MKRRLAMATVGFFLATGSFAVVRADLYWDVNGASAGGSDTDTAPGIWGMNNFWSTDSEGNVETGPWVADETAVFSAGSNVTGTYTVTLSGTQSAAGIRFEEGEVTIAGGTELTLTGGASVTVSSPTGIATITSVIGGSAGLNSVGPGVLQLGGANTYSGPTTVGSGSIVRLVAAGVIPDQSVLTIPNGNVLTAFQLNGFNETVRSISSAGTGSTNAATIAIGSSTLTIDDQAGDDFTFTGLYSTSPGGRIVKNGAGTLTLNNFPSNFTGGEFILNSGVVVIGQNNVFGTNANASKLTINGGTLRKGSGAPGSNVSVLNIDINASFNVDFTATNDLQFLGSGGNVTTTLKSDNPTITITGGSSAGGTLIFAGDILDDGNIRGFTKAGPGTLILGSPSNAYRGETTIQEGFLRVRKQTIANRVGAARIGDGNGRVNLSGGTLEYNGSVLTAGDPRTFTVTNPIHVTADSGIRYFSTTANLGATNTIEFIFSSDSITATGGTLTFSNSGSCTDNDNTCMFRPTFSGSGFDFSRPVVISNHSSVATRSTQLVSSNASGTQTWSGAISGDGSFRRTGAGATVFTGANTFSGGTTVDGGTLTVSGASATFGGGNVMVNAGSAVISTGVANAIADTATLTLLGGGTPGVADTGFIHLGAGINEVVAGLVLGTTPQANGTYGSTASSATFKFDEYFAGTGIITVATPGLAGDYNGDGQVDAADYVLWRKAPASFGGDPAGYNTWRANVGAMAGSGSAGSASPAGGAVPEPATGWLLAVVASVGLVAGCRGGHRNA